MGRAFQLPPRLTLPSGAVVALQDAPSGTPERVSRAPGAPLFSELARALDEGRVVATFGKKPLDLDTLPLADFHVLRAVLTKSRVLDEDPVAISCRNCGAAMTVRPCEALEIGPWAFGELGDAELDATLPFGEAAPVPPIALGRVRTARTVVLEPRTVAEASALFHAAQKPTLEVTPAVVRAMGITSLGSEREPSKIAAALAACDDDAFAAVSDAFLASHYPPRLGAVILCAECGARNDVDAPYARELAAGGARETAAPDSEFPSFDVFADRARELAAPLLAELPGGAVELVVEGETPAVDDGGEPLLGSYVPPHPGDAGTPTQAPVVTVYYRTFRAMWDEDGPYDWSDELSETIEHELDHHVSYLRGDDPMDDEERAVIRDEARRIVGASETQRRAIEGFGSSLGEFLRRTWPLWVLAAVALLFMLATQR